MRFAAVGDLQLGDSPTTVGYGFYSRHRGRPLEELFTDVAPALAGADIVFGNLETTLVAPPPGDRHREVLQLRGEPGFARGLRRAGFTVVNVANNHAVQHGTEAFHATVASLRAAGIECCGVRGSGVWTSEPALLLRADGPVGLLGYCLRPRQYGAAVPPYAEGTPASMYQDVARLRATCTAVIVSLHWGEEFVPQPSTSEIATARAIIDAGALAVIGHHPHVTRPVERYRNGVIAYSLGNFIGDMIWYPPFRRGVVLRCALEADHIGEVETVATVLRDDYRPSLVAETPTVPVAEGTLRGLDEQAYARAISVTMRRQRLAAYRAALVNLHRTPRPILVQLAVQTLRNKLTAVTSRLRGGTGRAP